MLSKTIVLGASLVETSPHLDWAATRLNASQHHQSSSHSEQIATNPYSQQIGQFPQNRLNLGLWVLAWRSSWLPYSADLFCSFWSLYVFHKKFKERNMKESRAISDVNSSLKKEKHYKCHKSEFFQNCWRWKKSPFSPCLVTSTCGILISRQNLRKSCRARWWRSDLKNDWTTQHSSIKTWRRGWFRLWKLAKIGVCKTLFNIIAPLVQWQVDFTWWLCELWIRQNLIQCNWMSDLQ